MVGLGDLPGGEFFSEASGASAGGSVVVGGGGNSAMQKEAFRWTSGGGMVGLGDLPGGSFHSFAYGNSEDGSVVVGESYSSSGSEAFRWSSAGGIVGLGDLPGGFFGSVARAVSADGTVVVGGGNLAFGQGLNTAEAFRWTSEGGMVGLGDLPGGVFASIARSVSADGTVVVGVGNLNISNGASRTAEAFRWTSAGGMVGLGDPPGGDFFSEATDVSADGSVIVGNGTSTSSPEAFYWTSNGGMQNLRELLIAGGATGLTDRRLTGASAVSSDGRTIVGIGRDGVGNREAWVATIPEPSTLTLAAITSFAFLAASARRR